MNPGEEEGWLEYMCENGVKCEQPEGTSRTQTQGCRHERQGGPDGALVLTSSDRVSLVPWEGQRLPAQYTRLLHYPLGPLDNVNSSCC